MFWLWQLFVQAMEKQKNTEIEVKSANVEEGNASAILTETDGKVDSCHTCHADVSSHCFLVVDLCKDISAKVEEHIIKGLRSLHPDHQFIGEESMAEVRLLMHSTVVNTVMTTKMRMMMIMRMTTN